VNDVVCSQAVNPDQRTIENPLADYARTLRRRKWWIVGTTALVGVAALGYSLTETKQYTASATLQVVPNSNSAPGNAGGGQQVQTQQVATDVALMTTSAVKQDVAKALGLPSPPPVSASSSGANNLFTVSSSGATPALAAEYADKYANEFVALQKQRAEQVFGAAQNSILSQIANDETAILSEKKVLATAKPPLTPQQQEAQVAINNLNSKVTSLKTELATVLLNATLATGGVTLASQAPNPKSPSSPKTARNIGLGLVVGLIFGIILAFVIDGFDDSIKSESEVDHVYPGLPHLGIIPLVDGWDDASRPFVVSLTNPAAVAAEAYRSLRTAIEFARLNRSVRSILVTSSVGLEGKTSTAANLGVAFAGSGQLTLIVSADLRRPRLGTFFGRSEDVGLTSLALEIATPEEAIQPIEEVAGLYFLGTGPLPAGPAEFLSSPKLEEVIRGLRDRFDLVIIDAPPVLPVTDAVVMSRFVDGVLMVVAQNRTRRRGLARVNELLSQVDAPLIGSIINGAAVRGADSYGYYGGYGGYGSYGPQGDKNSKRADRKRSKSGSSRQSSASSTAAGGTDAASGTEMRTGT
jgi:capsular exopolysaccharide synthesis family protein